MIFKKRFSSSFKKIIWQTVATAIVLVISFVVYSIAEERNNKFNDLRLNSSLLVHELRQSSDDLTNMVRLYVANGDRIYKNHYQEILDIRNGKKPHPIEYNYIYWDLVEVDNQRPCPFAKESISLLDMMKKIGFTKEELVKLKQAKKQSDKLTKIEFEAMRLVELSGTKVQKVVNRDKAISLLFDHNYLQAKKSIMKPIYEVDKLVDNRTLKVAKNSHTIANVFKFIFIITGVLFFFMLWRLNRALNIILGDSVDSIKEHITNIGRGDFSNPIVVKSGMDKSVLGWLGKMQKELQQLIFRNEEFSNLYSAMSRLNQAIVYSKNKDELFSAICHDTVEFGKMQMSWIGMLDESGQNIQVVNSYGKGIEYLDGIVISNNPNDPSSKGPAGVAFREEHPVWCQDFQSNKISNIWHGKAKQFGLAASAVLPLYRNKEIVGIFVVYSATKNAFDEKKQQLLQEMAVNVNFALDNFDREDKRVQAELAIIKEKEIAQNYLDIVDAMILVLDTEHNVKLINRRGCEIIGYPLDEIIGKNWINNFIPERYRNPVDDVAKTIIDKNVSTKSSFENPILRSDGEERLISWKNTTLFDEDGNSMGILTYGEDITEQREAEEKLKHIAHYDTLTNLPNRVLLSDRLSQSMAQSKRQKKSLAVVYIDLDGFKEVNDTHGHDVGDKLLVKVSYRMKEALREGDTISRFGGDEFVVVLADLDKGEDCEPVLQRLLQATSTTVVVDDAILNVSASIGVTIFPQDASDVDELMRHADQAMYQAKQAGKNRYHMFDIQNDSATKIKLESIEHIKTAMKNNEFVLYYQPKVNIRTAVVVGFEALIRWQHPKRGLVPPLDFLPAIEENIISIELGEWVIETALKQIESLKALGLEIPISVNIGALQLEQDNFVTKLEKLLARHSDVEPRFLELEVLETSALDDVRSFSAVMNACLKLGVSFALDDFGTGYSSLTYLRHLPAKLIKIDQTFVRDMLVDSDDFAIVQGVTGLANSFNREVIAEGVETAEHAKALLGIGCELVQGYGIAKPMPALDVYEWINTWELDASWKV
jgi:diguanylate cyclase (GGDEF)-like protein/PAS domain S-box-containing protein